VLEKGHPNALKVPRLIFHFKLDLTDLSQGGKRPYHTIIPALATRGDDMFLSYGVMGGFMQVKCHHFVPESLEAERTSQPQGHVQVLLNILRGFSPQAALDAPRFCISPGSPDTAVTNADRAGDINSEVYFEDGISPEVVQELKGNLSLTFEFLFTIHDGQPWDMMLACFQDSREACSGAGK
jgi:Gamma-glutamyltranspeptidase